MLSSGSFEWTQMRQFGCNLVYGLKIFTAFYTAYNRSGTAHEWSFFTKREERPLSWQGAPSISDYFEVESWHGSHYCLLHDLVEAESLADFQRLTRPDAILPFATVKTFALRISAGLCDIHKQGFIFAALRPDNVATATVGIYLTAQLLERPKTNGEARLPHGPVPITVSQPLRSTRAEPGSYSPLEGVEDFEVQVRDFNFMQAVGHNRLLHGGLPESYQAPEVILRAPCDFKLDIWSLGCLVYEMMTGRQLFEAEDGPTWSATDARLFRMSQIAGQAFPIALLAQCERKSEFFDDVGNQLRCPELPHFDLERDLLARDVSAEQVASVAAFLRRCFALDPAARASAEAARSALHAFAPDEDDDSDAGYSLVADQGEPSILYGKPQAHCIATCSNSTTYLASPATAPARQPRRSAGPAKPLDT